MLYNLTMTEGGNRESFGQAIKRNLVETGARFSGKINLKPGHTFGLGWNQVGEISAIIGPKRERQKGELGIHVNLTDLPTSDGTRLWIQVAKKGWANIRNDGSIPVRVALVHLDEQSLHETSSDVTKNIEREDGKIKLMPGDSISTHQGGTPFHIEWEDLNGQKTDLQVESQKNYITDQSSLLISYKAAPGTTS